MPGQTFPTLKTHTHSLTHTHTHTHTQSHPYLKTALGKCLSKATLQGRAVRSKRTHFGRNSGVHTLQDYT